MQTRGSSAYLAEFIGTFILVLAITVAASSFAASGDFVLIGLVHAFTLFVLIQTLAVASGAHFNPAVTAAMVALRQISPANAAGYVGSQVLGGVFAALVTRLLLHHSDVADQVNFGAPAPSKDLLDGSTLLAMLGEGIGAFMLVFVIVGVAVNPSAVKEWAGLAIGVTLGVAVFMMGPLTGASFNPARAFGPMLVSGEFGGFGTFLFAYVVAPVVGAVLAAVVYFNLYIAPGRKEEGGLEPVG